MSLSCKSCKLRVEEVVATKQRRRMQEFILHSDKYFYILWAATWFTISVINTDIYKSYNNEETAKLENYWLRSDIGANVLIYFTFRWILDEHDTKKITRLKKILNYLSIFFVLLTVYCIGVWAYQFNHK